MSALSSSTRAPYVSRLEGRNVSCDQPRIYIKTGTTHHSLKLSPKYPLCKTRTLSPGSTKFAETCYNYEIPSQCMPMVLGNLIDEPDPNQVFQTQQLERPVRTWCTESLWRISCQYVFLTRESSGHAPSHTYARSEDLDKLGGCVSDRGTCIGFENLHIPPYGLE